MDEGKGCRSAGEGQGFDRFAEGMGKGRVVSEPSSWMRARVAGGGCDRVAEGMGEGRGMTGA
jgi:hypothetical protein